MATEFKNGLAVEIQGSGEPLLCIHGLGGSSNTWTPLLSALERYTVIRPDLPGSARSALSERKLSIGAYVDAMEALLAELQLPRVHVVAHSMGTIVAQHLALRQPSKVMSLALFGPLVAPPEAARPGIRARAVLARTGAGGMQQIADAIVAGATSKQTQADQPAVLALVRESVMRQPAEGYAQSCEALADAEAAAIEQIRIPTLLVTGDQDGVAPPANVKAMQTRIAESNFALVPACGHWTTFEQPGACMQELENFYGARR
jgi:pimeloyl-ACP methyl ester carboxylesterase